MADNKILLFDKITKLPITEVLTNLQYRKDKDYADKAQRELDQKLAKLKQNANN